MKTIFFKILIVVGLVVNIMYCKAQTLPLNTWVENTPNNAHLKDLDNELVPYIGTYKANYKGNEITLFITKEEDKLIKYSDKQFYKDVLLIKYIVKNSSGIIIQDTQNINHASYFKITSMGTMPPLEKVAFSYSGTNCGVGWGQIDLKKLNATQISWDYYPNSMILDEATCPSGTDTKVYLPHTKGLIFTKQ
ncbi:MAG: hypothetical protein J6O88_03550 [Chryseobacterium sp.]|uniref:hypothetical protein n=1 Tax=Chryseobacterium sp. TaxID=1871047 RepID=UPI001B205665|nr:hypothetical protein [Chryseobacterium sp.]MBO6183755.1 hypothetical protein [Chryseobacterium sp.]